MLSLMETRLNRNTVNMPNETTSPFQPNRTRKTNDTELVAGVLGTDAAAEMEALVGGQTEPLEAEPTPLDTEMELSAKEQTNTTEAEKTVADLRRDEYIEWAVQHDLKREWVDETFTFNTDGTVMAEGDVVLFNRGVKTLPLKLIEVVENFDLSTNQIISLEGLPSTVGGTLDLTSNQIISLEGLPSAVGGDLDLNNNQITSLKGLPSTVGRGLYLYDNQITSLKGLPDTVGGDINLCNNKITSLEGLLSTVSGALDLSDNQITSLEGLSNTVSGNLYLNNIPATTIPEGLSIKGEIYLMSSQTELIADCRAKGYNINIK